MLGAHVCTNTLHLGHVLMCARTRCCWVYDLEVSRANLRKIVDEGRVSQGLERAADFKGSLLHCLVNGVEQSRQDRFNKMRAQVVLAIKWKRPDALHFLLRRNAARMQRYPFQTLIDRMLHTAVESHNEEAVVKLLEYGARLSAYEFAVRGGDEEAGQQHHDSLASKGRLASEKKLQKAAQLWENLIVATKSDPSTRHVSVLLKLKKREFRDRVRLRGRARGKSVGGGGGAVDGSDLSSLTGAVAFDGLEWSKVISQMGTGEVEEEELEEIKQRCKTWQRIVLLQSLYGDIMG